jgi:membrane fusion protein, copper/silver efflux system
MKKQFILILSIIVLLLSLSCNSGTPKTDSTISTPIEMTSFYYTCPMHPEIHNDKPGKCPICGMDLVKTVVVNTDSTQIK